MDFFVIYDHPRDFPNEFVCRKFHWNQPGELVARGTSIEDVRALLPRGSRLYNLGRMGDDDPAIAEVWI